MQQKLDNPIHCFHILIKHTSSTNPVSRRTGQPIVRSKEEAYEYAFNLSKLLCPDNFARVARDESDCASYNDGGDLGVFTKIDMHPRFTDAAYSLDFNEISEVIQTPSGYHLILRVPLLPRIRCAHILIKHILSSTPVCRRTNELINRTKDEALALIKSIQVKIAKRNFEDKARRYSECSSYRKGGDLGFFEKGDMQLPFEEAAFGLQIDQISGVVSSPSGFHLIIRLE